MGRVRCAPARGSKRRSCTHTRSSAEHAVSLSKNSKVKKLIFCNVSMSWPTKTKC